jgi:recombinational DNA repair protein (RecF pathway)
MSKGSVAKANADMAKYLKEKGVKRDYCNCAICHRKVGLAGYHNHLRLCQGR